MRGKLFLTLSLCGLFLSSCDFSQDFGEVSSTESSDVTLTVNVSADDAIARVSGGLNRPDNALKIRLSGAVYESADDCLTLTPMESGTSVMSFEGVIPEYGEKDNVYLYYSADGSFSGTGFTKAISASQSGRAEDILDNVLYYSWARWDAIAAGRNGNAVEIAADMSPMAALIKFNIPEQLQARNIRIKASAPIAGTVTVNPQKGWGGIGDNALLQSEGLHHEIVIESEDLVGGDLYVVVMPDSFDKASNAYCNTAQTITFSCDYYEGELSKRYSLNDYIVCGAVTDLGQIPMPKPKIPVEPGTIRLSSDINLTVAIDGSDPDCEYYYEVGTSAETCPVPTINSTKFDPQSGFCPEIKGHFDRFYIKVRAHALSTDYSDVVIEASLRNWTFTDGSEAGAILAEAFAGNKLTVKNEQITTSDGMILKRKQDYAANDLKFEQTSARIALVSAKIALYMPVEYESQATMWFCIDKRTCIGTGKRGFNLYYNDNSGRVNEFNGYNVKTLVDGAVEATSGKKAILWPLGQLHEGDKVAPAGDGQHVLYSMALLEVL